MAAIKTQDLILAALQKHFEDDVTIAEFSRDSTGALTGQMPLETLAGENQMVPAQLQLEATTDAIIARLYGNQVQIGETDLAVDEETRLDGDILLVGRLAENNRYRTLALIDARTAVFATEPVLSADTSSNPSESVETDTRDLSEASSLAPKEDAMNQERVGETAPYRAIEDITRLSPKERYGIDEAASLLPERVRNRFVNAARNGYRKDRETDGGIFELVTYDGEEHLTASGSWISTMANTLASTQTSTRTKSSRNKTKQTPEQSAPKPYKYKPMKRVRAVLDDGVAHEFRVGTPVLKGDYAVPQVIGVLKECGYENEANALSVRAATQLKKGGSGYKKSETGVNLMSERELVDYVSPRVPDLKIVLGIEERVEGGAGKS